MCRTRPTQARTGQDPLSVHLIPPVIAPALCIKPRKILTTGRARKVYVLKDGSNVFCTKCSLAMRFKGVLCGAHSEPLEQWMGDAVETGLVSIFRFACRFQLVDAIFF